MSLLNGLSAMGAGVAQYAGTAGLEAQKAALDEQRITLASQLQEGVETRGRTQTGLINATAAQIQQQHDTDIEAQKEKSSADLQTGRLASQEKEDELNRGVQREGLVPTDVRDATWLASATPEQKLAYQQSLLAKAGMPSWLATSGGNSPSVSGVSGSTTAAPGNTATGGSTGTTAGTQPSDPATGGKAANTTGSTTLNEQALAKMPPEAQATVKAMVDGRIAPPSAYAMAKSPYWAAMQAAAGQYDPTFDQTTWAGRVATRKDFASGQSAKAVTALNTALGHAGVVSDALDNLNNFGGAATPLNGLMNSVEKTFGDSRQTNAQEAVDALASEARKVFAATGGGNQTELENWQKNFPINGAPDQQKGALKEFVNLLDSRLSALSDQYNRGMSKTDDPMNLLNPQARQVYENLTGRQPENATGYQSGQAPAPKTAAPPASAVITPKTQADIDNAPSGSLIQTPSGLMRKP